MARTLTTSSLHAWLEPGLNQHEPTFTAFQGDDYLAAGDCLSDLLDEVQGQGEDCVVWRHDGVLAAAISRGTTQVFVAAPGSVAPSQTAEPKLLKRRGRAFSIKRRPRV